MPAIVVQLLGLVDKEYSARVVLLADSHAQAQIAVYETELYVLVGQGLSVEEESVGLGRLEFEYKSAVEARVPGQVLGVAVGCTLESIGGCLDLRGSLGACNKEEEEEEIEKDKELLVAEHELKLLLTAHF